MFLRLTRSGKGVKKEYKQKTNIPKVWTEIIQIESGYNEQPYWLIYFSIALGNIKNIHGLVITPFSTAPHSVALSKKKKKHE